MLSVLILVAAGWSGNPPADCADQTQAGLSACAAVELDAAERALNATYRELMSKLAPADQVRLREAERSWVDWREGVPHRRVHGVLLLDFVRRFQSCHRRGRLDR